MRLCPKYDGGLCVKSQISQSVYKTLKKNLVAAGDEEKSFHFWGSEQKHHDVILELVEYINEEAGY